MTAGMTYNYPKEKVMDNSENAFHDGSRNQKTFKETYAHVKILFTTQKYDNPKEWFFFLKYTKRWKRKNMKNERKKELIS